MARIEHWPGRRRSIPAGSWCGWIEYRRRRRRGIRLMTDLLDPAAFQRRGNSLPLPSALGKRRVIPAGQEFQRGPQEIFGQTGPRGRQEYGRIGGLPLHDPR